MHVWQDGTISDDVDSALLLPVKHTDEHDFYPNSFVNQQHNVSDMEGAVQPNPAHLLA